MAPVDFDRIKEQGKRFVDGFTPGQKAMTILGIVAVVFAGMTFMRWAGTPDYAPLYTGLSSQDAGQVTQALDAANVKYKITGGGGTILVARPDVYKTRADLSTKNIPSGGGDTFALLDKQGITTDQFTRNVDYQRALQGELARTIEAIDGVSSASVTLTIPSDTVFVGGTQDKPTAAVLVQSAGTLGDSTVQAIAHLVASSIPNMQADDVTIADANGKVLHAPGMDDTGGSSLEQQQGYEASVEKRISDMIAASLGPGHAAVTVAATLDMSKTHTDSTTYQPPVTGTTAAGVQQRAKNAVPIEQNNTSEILNQPGQATTGGVVGVGNNGATTTGANANTNYNKTSTAQKNALDTTTSSSDVPPGAVKKMSVSVLLDSNASVTPADVTNKWTPAILAAAGIDTARDGANALNVQVVPFNADVTKAAKAALSAGAAAAGNPMFDLIKHVLTLMMIGLILFFAWRAIKRAEANRVPLRVPIDLRELEAPAAQPLALATVGAPAAAAPRRSLEPPPPSIEGEITDLIERQPDEVAQTLRSWLADRRS